MAKRQALADLLRNELEIETGSTSLLSEIFDEEPPPLSVFVSDKHYLNNGNARLSEMQYDFVRHFEQVLDLETYILMVEEFGEYWSPVRYVNHLAAEWGKGGGKDHTCQVSFARTSNILLCLKNPNDYYGLAPQTIIHMLNVAASAPQAHGVFFKPLRWMITHSPWFADKFEGDPPGPQASEVRFAKQIELISGHSQAETLEGKNLIAAMADEISAFPTKEEVQQSRTGRVPSKTSDAILEMLQSSATTRFPKQFKLAQISYPRFKNDAIEQAIAKGRRDNEAKGDSSRYFVSGPAATWEVNPRYEQFDFIDVPGASVPVPDVPSIVEDYESNPAYARGKYECRPSLSENRFMSNDAAIYAAFTEIREEPVEVEYYWGLDDAASFPGSEDPVAQTPGWQVRFHFHPDFRPVQGALYTVHGDLAIKSDRAGVAMTHVRTWEHREWPVPGGSVLERRPVVKEDFATCFTADPTTPEAPREIQIRWFRKLVWVLRARGFEIANVSCDNFQSVDSLQILESWGIQTSTVSTDRSPAAYSTLRDLIYDGRFEGYSNDLLVYELRALTTLRNGKIDHPPGGSKDIADAVAGAAFCAIGAGGDEGESPVYSDVADLSAFGGIESNDLNPDDMFGTTLGMDGTGVGSYLW